MKELGINAATLAMQTALGLALEKHNDNRQIRQQGKLQGQQIQGQKQMGEFNQQLALDMWDKTNYTAQRDQLKKAGLNIGLLYGMGGGGSATTHTPTGNVEGGKAPAGGGEIGMGLQLGMQKALQEAQIENIKANTEKTKVDTQKTAGVDTAAIAQQTATSSTQQEVLKLEQQLKQIAISIQTQTIDETVRKIQAEVQKAEGEAEKAKNEGTMSTDTYNQVKQQIQQTTLEQAGRIALQKTSIKATDAQINKWSNEVWQIYNNANLQNRQLNQQEQQILIQKAQQEFNTSEPKQIQQYVDIWRTIVDGISGALKSLK